MTNVKYLFILLVGASLKLRLASANPSAVELVGDIYKSCLKDFSLSCVQPKAIEWTNSAVDSPVIKITEDLAIIRNNYRDADMQRGQRSVLEKFEDFLISHNLVAKVPALLRPDGPLGKLVPRTFQPEPIQVALVATGRSKLVKKVIFPFLLGLKFKTAILVPLAITLIALKTWKALTLGLISLVLTGAIAIFSKFSKPPSYEVLHYAQPVVDHHIVEPHHIDVIPQPLPLAAPVPVAAPVPYYPPYRNKRSAAELAYRSHL